MKLPSLSMNTLQLAPCGTSSDASSGVISGGLGLRGWRQIEEHVGMCVLMLGFFICVMFCCVNQLKV